MAGKTKKSSDKKVADSVAPVETAVSPALESRAKVNAKKSNQTAGKEAVAEKSKRLSLQLKIIATLLAFILRFWRISLPECVVFDEVHFGKFASHYLQREYYFDLHPPLAKLMFAGVGWLVGYDGRFKFDNIGDSYVSNQVPYVAYRSLPALLGSLTVPIVFSILEDSGFSPYSCFLGAAIIVFDNAQIAQTRLILLDAALSFFMIITLFSYVRFRKQRKQPFGIKWWFWLLLTGVGLSSVMSTKYVGLFTYMTIGVAVVADLWNILDVRGKTPENQVPLRIIAKHFMARLWALIIIPLGIFLFWFYVHFAILKNSGPGDVFMTPEFQATLSANPLAKEALDLRFFDTVRIQSQNQQYFLHSHPHNYPLQYPDGRISSQGQQVVGYPTKDPNNLWQILPPVHMEEEELSGNSVISANQHIMLRHVATDTFLLTHDVASPSFSTNEEFTTVSRELAYGSSHSLALFSLNLISGGPIARTKMSLLRLNHVETSVSMWLSDELLPDWGFGMIEINGNKKLDASGSVWTFSEIVGLSEEEVLSRRSLGEGEVAPRRPFLTDYLELQEAMFRSNNGLTESHPYMSSPYSWPLLLNGISFWSAPNSPRQIFLVGNFVGWYAENIAILLFVALYAFDWFAILRNIDWITPYSRQKLHNTLLWYFLGWAFHYLPFFLMGRQLFLHHYLPAQIIAALLTGGLVDFVTGNTDSYQSRPISLRSTKVICLVFVAALIACFVFFAPLTYGLKMSTSAIQKRQWNNIQLHFNK